MQALQPQRCMNDSVASMLTWPVHVDPQQATHADPALQISTMRMLAMSSVR